jgi:hypothetical protein
MTSFTSVYTKREAEQMANMLDELREAESSLQDAENDLKEFYASHKAEEDRLIATYDLAKGRAKTAAWVMSRVGNLIQADALRRYAAQVETGAPKP